MFWRKLPRPLERDGEGKHAGTIGDICVFSFFPTKTLGGYGDGGMIVTNIRVIYEKSLCYRVHGASSKYYYDYLGYNSRLDELQAAILNVKLKYIDQSIEKRRKIATLYMEHLRDCPGIRMPTVKWPHQSVYYVFNILADKRDALRNVLKKQYRL